MNDIHLNRRCDVVEENWTQQDIAELCPSSDSISKFQDKFMEVGRITGKMYLMASGRQALEYLIASLPHHHGRTDVLLSAFNCPVVPKAIRAAGYRPVFYDLSSTQGDVNWNEVAKNISARVAAIVITHFFGAPTDAEPLRSITRKAGIYVIEDCAHTFDASIRGTSIGSIWDAAIFSFNYGKPISLCGGAALVLNTEATRFISPPVNNTGGIDEYLEIGKYLKALAASKRAISPAPFPLDFVRRVLRRLKLKTPVTPRLAQGVGTIRAALGLVCLSRWHQTQLVRNANVNYLAKRDIPLWHLPNDVLPSWLRLRITLRDKEAVRYASNQLRKRGYRAGNFNWPSVDNRAKHLLNASQAAACGIDIPIHQNMTIEDLEFVGDVLAPFAATGLSKSI